MSKQSPPFKIIFEDTHLIVVDKSAGLLSQGESTGDLNLVDLLREHFGRNYVGLVHRLDRNTSGVMVVAKRTKSADRLTKALQLGKIDRSYLAVLLGNLAQESTWKDYLVKDHESNLTRVVDSKTNPGAKLAELTVTPLETLNKNGERFTLARFVLETGRSHQIRAQAAHHGYPLLGDRKYSSKVLGSQSSDFMRPALHSHQISFPHPMTQEMLTFEAELPSDINNFLKNS